MLLKVGELAKRSGLTVRTLHHFDQIGLLSPQARSEAGYRLYGRVDVARLHGIQALRQLGLSLKDIASMLAGDGATLPVIVARQIRALDHEISQTTDLRARLSLLMDRFNAGGQPDMADWLSSLEMVATYAKYFSTDEIKRIVGHWHEVEAEWPALVAEVRLMMEAGVPATDLAMQPLAQRWMGLIHHWLGGDFDLIDRWGRMVMLGPATHLKNTGPDLVLVRYVEQATEQRMARWLAHFSMADLSRFGWVPLHEWRALDQAVSALIQRATQPTAPEARALGQAADKLVRRVVGGDAALLQILATAMAVEPVLRAGMNLTPPVQAYLQQVRAQGLDPHVT